eukprot:1145823-Pelagomonas_calceolata.AAC.15
MAKQIQEKVKIHVFYFVQYIHGHAIYLNRRIPSIAIHDNMVKYTSQQGIKTPFHPCAHAGCCLRTEEH